MMIESRCGILCRECPFLADGTCQGCTKIDKPFWGDTCPIQTCCTGKELEHCGLCPQFPCQQLHQFAYDEAQGDNGKRLEQCKAWKKEQAGRN